MGVNILKPGMVPWEWDPFRVFSNPSGFKFWFLVLTFILFSFISIKIPFRSPLRILMRVENFSASMMISSVALLFLPHSLLVFLSHASFVIFILKLSLHFVQWLRVHFASCSFYDSWFEHILRYYKHQSDWAYCWTWRSPYCGGWSCKSLVEVTETSMPVKYRQVSLTFSSCIYLSIFLALSISSRPDPIWINFGFFLFSFVSIKTSASMMMIFSLALCSFCLLVWTLTCYHKRQSSGYHWRLWSCTCLVGARFSRDDGSANERNVILLYFLNHMFDGSTKMARRNHFFLPASCQLLFVFTTFF